MGKKSKTRQASDKNDNEENIPGIESDQIVAETNATATNDSKKVKKSKPGKTKKLETHETESAEGDSQKKKSLKRGRQSSSDDLAAAPSASKKKLKKAAASEEVTPTPEAPSKQKKKGKSEEGSPPAEAASQQKQGKEKKVKPVSSYTLFIGNIPFSVEKEHLQKHFVKVAPSLKSVRLLAHKDSGQSRGIAFIEVCGEKDYQAALSLDKSFLMGRRINVEYTCAGSKNGKKRAAKITAKNLKFNALQRRGIMTQTAGQARAASREARGGAKKQW